MIKSILRLTCSNAAKYGEVSERFKELVLKTSDSERDRGFESHPLRHVSPDSSVGRAED